MNKLLATKATSISEFKDNPNAVLKEANGEPFVVLTNNKPSFYVISPSAYEELLEQLWELEITPLLAKRLSDLKSGKSKSIQVTIEDLIK